MAKNLKEPKYDIWDEVTGLLIIIFGMIAFFVNVWWNYGQ